MYDIINRIISHTWQTNASEQQYIYFACCAVVILLVVCFVDIFRTLFIRRR